MILIHAQVREPAENETDAFEGHNVAVVLPHFVSDEDRELLKRFAERVTTEED